MGVLRHGPGARAPCASYQGRQPYQLYTARSADEAIHTLETRNVDIIVTDEKMPGMSGTDLLARVAKDYPQVMRILLTGHASTETAIRASNIWTVSSFNSALYSRCF